MFDLTGKTALVTGATGGIGAAIAKVLHKAGATVAISGTRANVLEELKAELGGERVFVLPCNLSDAAAVEKLVPEAEAAMGLRTEAAVLLPIEDVLEFDGIVDLPPGARATVASQIAGRLSQIHVVKGQLVAAGEVLAELSSLELLDMQLLLMQAASQQRLHAESLRRLKALEASESVPRKRVLEVESTLLAASERVEALGRKLRAVGLEEAAVQAIAAVGVLLVDNSDGTFSVAEQVAHDRLDLLVIAGADIENQGIDGQAQQLGTRKGGYQGNPGLLDQGQHRLHRRSAEVAEEGKYFVALDEALSVAPSQGRF